MDKAIFTEDMTADEFIAKVLDLDTPEKREEATVSLINVLSAKLDSDDWEFIENLGITAGPGHHSSGLY
jgi:hypothetical protein